MLKMAAVAGCHFERIVCIRIGESRTYSRTAFAFLKVLMNGPLLDHVLFRLNVVSGEAEVVELAGEIVAEIGPFIVGTGDGL